ncbi:MAG: hypothetical protein LCH41_07980 [Armatimonadetes bacterium]|nr:hypothetical protein [Armatimonadota bacterium]
MLSSLLLGSTTPSNFVYEAKHSAPEGANLKLSTSADTWAEIRLSKEGEQWVATVRSQKNGVATIGTDPRFPKERCRQVLDGRYSLPFRVPDGRLRAFRDTVGEVIRFSWGFESEVAGKKVKGWIELAPLPDPLADGEATATPKTVKSTQFPTKDRDDRATGFEVTKRPFHWSGAFGDALVVTFDDAFAWRRQDIKLAFWSEAAWTPFWKMSPKAMSGFEFIETWGGGAPGCFEPMSDRVNRWASAEVLEDGTTRKIIRWKYALVNPDYIPWAGNKGSKQVPEVEEEWTILPDGTVYRLQRFWPSLDTGEPQHSLGVQLAEADVVFAADTLPEEVVPRETLTAFGADGRRVVASYPTKNETRNSKVGDWPRFGYAIHFLDPALPDPFIGFADPGLDSSLDWAGTWHEQQFWRFSHFPFNNEPFVNESNSQLEGRGAITHTCLAYVGDARRRDWSDNYKVDARGRKYREWVSVLGMEPKGNLQRMDNRLKDWQEGKRWTKLVSGAKATWNSACGEIRLTNLSEKVVLSPSFGRLPSLIFEGKHRPTNMTLNGRGLKPFTDFRMGTEGGQVLIWFSPNLEPGQLELFVK